MILIVSVDTNWGIGYQGNLLMRVPEDMKRFRAKTINNVIVMGRKTLESFPEGKPLKDRINIVISSNKGYRCEGVTVCGGIEEMLLELKKYETKEVFVVGGGTIYNQLLEYCDTAYITKFYNEFKADTYIVNLDKSSEWVEAEAEDIKEYNGINFRYIKYVRNNKKN